MSQPGRALRCYNPLRFLWIQPAGDASRRSTRRRWNRSPRNGLHFSPVPASYQGFVLVWSRNAETIYVASSTTPKARLDAIDVRLGSSRRIAEYPGERNFFTPNTYSLSGSLSRDAKSFATTVRNDRSDLWILEGFPQFRRRWF